MTDPLAGTLRVCGQGPMEGCSALGFIVAVYPASVRVRVGKNSRLYCRKTGRADSPWRLDPEREAEWGIGGAIDKIPALAIDESSASAKMAPSPLSE